MYTSSSTVSLKSVAIIALVASLAAGQGLNCESIWSGPSAQNDIAGCITSTSRAQNNYTYFVPLAAALIIFVLFFLIFPIMCMWCTCCKCCCNCCKDVPQGEREASKQSRLKVVVVMCICLCFGVTALAVLLSGAPKVSSGADGVFSNLQKHILDYFLNVIDTMVSLVKDPVSGNLTSPFDNATISTTKGYIYDIGNTTMKYRTDMTTYADLATKVGYGVAVIPVVLIGIAVLLSLCNCRYCLPTCCSCFYFLCYFIFSLLAIILFIIAPLLSALAAEIQLQEDRKPGIFQWYVIPYCEEQANFTSIKLQISDQEYTLAKEVCNQMTKYCGPEYYYNIANVERVFWCNLTAATVNSTCTSFNKTIAILDNTFTKSGAAPCGAANCTFRQCKTDCTDSQMRDTAKDAIQNIDMAGRLFNALDYLKPLMDCNVLSDRMLMMLKTMPEMRDGVWLLGAAFFITQVMLIFGVVVMLLGAKLWFSEKEYDDDAMEAEVDAEMKEGKEPA